MKGKLLIVEDEPIVALDLKQEVELLGCEVVGVAESADEALAAAGLCRPDLALMDVRIVGSVDGVQTARLLRSVYKVPAIFLTSYCDEDTLARAARELPYGYLTKPFQSRELKATLRMALHKAKVDAARRESHQELASTVEGMHEGVVMVSSEGTVRFMNAAAEALSGWSNKRAQNRPVREVLSLSDPRQRHLLLPCGQEPVAAVEEFGWTLSEKDGTARLVDVSIAPLGAPGGERQGYVITLRSAAERLRAQAIEETMGESHSFDQAPMGMVHLDAEGQIVRVNPALLRAAGVAAESLVGRTLTGLSMDPDPRIAKQLMATLMEGDTFMATARPGRIH